MGDEQGHREDHQAVEVIVQDVPHEFGQVQDVLGELDAQLHTQQDRQELERAFPVLPPYFGVFGQQMDQALEQVVQDGNANDVEQDERNEMHMRSPMFEFFHEHGPGQARHRKFHNRNGLLTGKFTIEL